jgi:NAD(P)-dependent dehydrogenase (short-subunit alcohol dehydrogenase family)
MTLKNKNILITGVGKGLGRNMVESFLESGAYVYGITRSANDIKNFKKHKNLKIFRGDVRNSNLIKKIFTHSIKKRKIINGLVNNAGIRQRVKFQEITQKNMKEVFDINFFSIFSIMKLYAKYCLRNKIKSSIINIGSIVGETGFSGLSGYSSTKGALKSMTQCFAVEYANSIRANVVNPGFIKTSYYKKFKKNKKLYNWTLSKIPQKRWGEPKEISSMVGFLLSDQSSYITGESINIDGGWLKS